MPPEASKVPQHLLATTFILLCLSPLRRMFYIFPLSHATDMALIIGSHNFQIKTWKVLATQGKCSFKLTFSIEFSQNCSMQIKSHYNKFSFYCNVANWMLSQKNPCSINIENGLFHFLGGWSYFSRPSSPNPINQNYNVLQQTINK